MRKSTGEDMNQRISSAQRAGAPPTAPTRARSRVKVLVTALGFVLVLTAVWMLLPAWRRGETTMPDELLGTWTTTAPAYADRALEIRPTALVFHTGAGSFNMHRVRRVVRDEFGRSAVYAVEYEDAGAVETLAIQYVRASRPAIRLRNQAFVWRRVPMK
jgi:hypothetical protein